MLWHVATHSFTTTYAPTATNKESSHERKASEDGEARRFYLKSDKTFKLSPISDRTWSRFQGQIVKRAEQFQAVCLAFFWVKLGRKQIVTTDRRTEFTTVITR